MFVRCGTAGLRYCSPILQSDVVSPAALAKWNYPCGGAFLNGARNKELFMKLATTLVATIAIFASATLANAGSNGGASANSPGHQMQQHGSIPGSPGASGYAPGHLKKKHGSAAEFAPGRRETTGSGIRTDANIRAGTRVRGSVSGNVR